MEAPCGCKNLQSDTAVESMFLVIVLDFYDGPTSGVMQCKTCANVYRFMMVDWDDDHNVRIHALAPLPPGSFQQVVDLLSQYESPRWPRWTAVLRNLSEEILAAIYEQLNKLVGSAGPATLLVALSRGGEQVLAVRALAASDPNDVQDWFSLAEAEPARDWFSFMGLIKKTAS
jgi:hypothetical protein